MESCNLIVDRGGIKIIHLDVGVRPNRVCQRAAVLGKLIGAEQAHSLDAKHSPAVHVRREFLVAVDLRRWLASLVWSKVSISNGI